MPYRPPRKGKQLPPVANSTSMARESLPEPLVYYPDQSGAFFAFGASRDERPALCACAEGAVRNLMRLSRWAEEAPSLDFGFFPDVIRRAAVGQPDPLAVLTFRPGLCHRCNRAAPTLRHCREVEGTRFVQTYGWYINQTYLRLGIHPTTHTYLPDVCPPEHHEVLGRIRALAEQAREVRAKLASLMNGPRREIPRSERTHWPNVTAAELAPLEALGRQMEKPKRELGNAIENLTRAEFGHRVIGDAWVHETELYQIICRLFPGETVLRHHRPDWMDGLELDLYLPGRNLALEYQGQQHFQPIKPWGGEPALLQLQARDARKAQICREAGVNLLTIHHDEPLTDEHIRGRIGLQA